MKSKTIKKACTFLCISLVLTGMNFVSFGELKKISDFSDISSTHWGRSSIEWGLANDIIGGYSSGLFKPNDPIKEAEFIAILSRYATNLPEEFPSIDGKHWAESYYNAMYSFQMPFRGYDSNTLRDTILTRGQVAIIVAAKYGFALTSKQAVYFMYENGLSNGNSKTEKTYESYGVGDPLTRTQTLAILQSIEKLTDREMTFKGNKSIIGKANATTVLGLVGLSVDNKIDVDFEDFNKPIEVLDPSNMTKTEMVAYLAKVTDISTKVVDGKVVAVMTKITTPTDFSKAFSRGYSKSMNYFVYNSEFWGGIYSLQNSIVLYNGIELPLGALFAGPEDMAWYYQIETGLLQLSLERIESDKGFNDKESFIKLLSNLKFFGATQEQINKAIEITNIHSEDNGSEEKYLQVVSESTGLSMVIKYGIGSTQIGLYNKAFVKPGQTIYVK